MATSGAPPRRPDAAGPAWAPIVQACHRLNPCFDLEVDLCAIERGAIASAKADWNPPATLVASEAGVVTMAPTAAVLFQQANTVSSNHFVSNSSQRAPEEYIFDFWPDPSSYPVPLTLASLEITMGRDGTMFPYLGPVTVALYQFDDLWRRVPMGSSFTVGALPLGRGVKVLSFPAGMIFSPGTVNTTTGAGRTNAGALREATVTVDANSRRLSHLSVPKGFSVGLTFGGLFPNSAYLGCIARATAAAYDPTTFWKANSGLARSHGPYDPAASPYSPLDLAHNALPYLSVGAVPGYGAIAVSGGYTGLSRRFPTPDDAEYSSVVDWDQPYFKLNVQTYSATSAVLVKVLDMGATPTTDVEIRLDDWTPAGSSLSYSLRGSANGTSWTSIGGIYDGFVLTSSFYYRYYELTATFTAGGGGTKYTTPSLQAWAMIARTRYATYKYLKDFDAQFTADPATGDVGVAELKLPMLKLTNDARDLATKLASDYAPSAVEAQVYGVNRASGKRVYITSFRMESRDAQDGEVDFTFLSGLDRLKVLVPPKTETYFYSGAVGSASVAGTVMTINSASSPWVAGALQNFRVLFTSGGLTGASFTPILSGNTGGTFTVTVDSGTGAPSAGDTFELHSDVYKRNDLQYTAVDFASVYSDLVVNQAQVPARYRGNVPSATGRLTTAKLANADGQIALDTLKEIALHCGGVLSWEQGRINYAQVYGDIAVSAIFDDRQIVTLDTSTGADRRMPTIDVKYGYDPVTKTFSNEVVTTDYQALLGSGRANLFDIITLSDTLCQWNDAAEAKHLAEKLRDAWSTGIRIWKVKTVLQWPWLQIGDGAAIYTTQYADRNVAFAGDGITDNGSPLRGRLFAVGVIVGRNLWGDQFAVAIPGLSHIQSAFSGTSSVGGVSTPVGGGSPPTAPSAASNTSIDTGSPFGVVNSVTVTDATATIRVYKNGAVFGSDLGPFALGAQSLRHNGMTSNEGAVTWQYSHVKAGLESAKTTSFSTTIPKYTLPTPTGLAVTVSAGGWETSWTPGIGTPAGVTWHVEISTTGGGAGFGEASESPTTATSLPVCFTGTGITRYFRVYGVISNWNDSATSSETSQTGTKTTPC